MQYCYKNISTGRHDRPHDLEQRHIVVSTCATAGWIADCELSFDSAALLFDLVVIDECAQAVEAEALIAMSLSRGSVLLCGDPKQFGPQLRSARAKTAGMGSLLDRLAALPRYQHSNRFHFTLSHNFRAHPQLMALSSSLFYGDAVRASLPPQLAEKALPFEDLNGSECPICFYGVAGQDERDEESFWNSAECFKVAELVQRVVASPALAGAFSAKDIGVVTPFYKQVRLIREVLRDRLLRDVRVGSVADYQGQEEEVLIVSAVRGTMRWLEHDRVNSAGLVFNDRSFNVCVSRAKCLLLCVGNPRVLSVDPNWRRLLQVCLQNQTYFGIPYDSESDRNFSPTERAADVTAPDYAALGAAAYYYDLPWELNT
jgi:helicase MOV-10